MKKIIVSVLAIAMIVVAAATVVSAAEITTAKSITVKTTIPYAKYTLHIPEDMQSVTYGEDKSYIGNVTVTGGENFAKGKNLEVAVTHSGNFTSDEAPTTIPFKLYQSHYTGTQTSTKYKAVELKTGDRMIFYGQSDTSVSEKATAPFTYMSGGSEHREDREVNSLYIYVDSKDWGKALAGNYSTTITFTAEVAFAQ